MTFKRTLVCRTVGAVLASTVALASGLATEALAGAQPSSQSRPSTAGNAQDGLRPAAMGGTCPMNTTRGPTGNCVEMIDPQNSTYVPNIAAASPRARTRAQRWLDGANHFCSTHTLDWLKAHAWRPGLSRPLHPTHYFNPDHSGIGHLYPAKPAAALVYDGKVGGVMFTGTPLPYLGSIPRAHTHAAMAMGSGAGVEMVHVYCTSSLKTAFTPNRMLGVMAATIALRLKIRPAVMDLNRWQLRAVRAKVRGYCGDRLQPVAPVGSSADGGPDPVLQAMRTEIRNSLMLLNETQLRSVWRLMQSY